MESSQRAPAASRHLRPGWEEVEERVLSRGAVATRGGAPQREVGVANVYYVKVSASDDAAAERMRTKAFPANLLPQIGHPTLRVTHEWPLFSGGSSWTWRASWCGAIGSSHGEAALQELRERTKAYISSSLWELSDTSHSNLCLCGAIWRGGGVTV